MVMGDEANKGVLSKSYGYSSISFTISLVVYLLLMPEDKKPSTFKQITLDHFLNIHKE